VGDRRGKKKGRCQTRDKFGGVLREKPANAVRIDRRKGKKNRLRSNKAEKGREDLDPYGERNHVSSVQRNRSGGKKGIKNLGRRLREFNVKENTDGKEKGEKKYRKHRTAGSDGAARKSGKSEIGRNKIQLVTGGANLMDTVSFSLKKSSQNRGRERGRYKNTAQKEKAGQHEETSLTVGNILR